MTIEKVGQTSFWSSDETPEVRVVPDKIKVGDNALSVFREVLRLNSNIEAFTITSYGDWSKSDDIESPLAQKLIYLPKSFALEDNILTKISNVNFLGKIFVEDNDCQIGDMIAIGSKVKLVDGTEMHIPMMDFASELDMDIMNIVAEFSRFNKFPGAILNSGNSYHYWGINLLTIPQYQAFMKKRLELEEGYRNSGGESFYDINYIKESVNRGFTALRIFGYPETEKDKEPSVVALIK